MSTVTIGTFNVENLFLRYRPFLNEEESAEARAKRIETLIAEGLSINDFERFLTDFGPIHKSARDLTARVILENDADILAVQEVENLESLIKFNSNYLDGMYKYMMVIDGNDPRQIDVGIMSKYEIGRVRSHRFEPEGSGPRSRTFSRDCLEVEILLGKEKRLDVLVNHFKSKLARSEEEARRGREKRRLQATRVAEILAERYGSDFDGDFVVLGDLNDGNSSDDLAPLIQHEGVENVVRTRLDPEEQWTHYYKRGKSAEQLDYVLVSKRLADRNTNAVPYIERRGLGADIDIYTGERFDPSVTGAKGASDHCPVFITLDI